MPRRLLLTLFASCLLWVAHTPAHAAVGVVVRLVSSGGALDGTVTATVKNADGAEVLFTLEDNGVAPDVFAGDHQYSASGLLDGTQATVFLSINGEELEAGEVTWQDDTTPRDLVITMGEGILTVETGVAVPMEGAPTDGAPIDGPPTDGVAPVAQAPGAPGGTAAESPARKPNVSFPGGRQAATDDTTLYLLGGALVLVLALAAFLWMRAPSAPAAGPRGSRHYTVQPEPGLLGSVTPSLSDGLSTWQIEPADSSDFVSLLLESMSQHHRVLVVTPEETSLPLVGGGPIYRARASSAVSVADAAIALMDQPGLPLAVLVWQEEIEGALISDYATVLTPDVGVIALVSRITGEHQMDVSVTRNPDGWQVRRGDTYVDIAMTEWGVRVSPAHEILSEPESEA